ncbi:MAG TPA: DEAD/DEAH box helicase [Longimicrobiales bacterium]|nr:DEAD/DEAH box helicase [Longimicrobiales bacterium]
MSSSQGHTARVDNSARAGNTNAGDAVRAGNFHGLGLNAELVRAVEELGFTRPTPVQAEAIPPALDGRDVLACAMTGSGKTAAFLLPILQRLKDRPSGRTRALILSPTRELAAQTHQHFEDLAKHTRVRGAAIFGGVGMKPQEDAFRKGVEIIAATPGRLLDHMQYDYAKLADIEILVLDEADRMLDMGFLPDIKRIMRQLPAQARQTMLFSATMPAPILELSRSLLDNPSRIAVERKQAPATGVAQALYPVPANLKVELLIELLRRDEIGNAIVFCRTKHRSNRLAEKLERAGIETARIHGNRSQNQRTEALAGFKSGRFRVLVATDIVARGIDVEALEHVVNFDVPNVPEDYIHRVGRTARAEATGDAYTFVSPDEENDVRAIERAVGRRIERRKLDGFDYTAKATERLEVPIGERIAEIRARKSEERARARANAEKKAARQAGGGTSGSSSSSERKAPRRRRRGGRGRPGGSGSQSSAA